jgi:hypothetical protein
MMAWKEKHQEWYNKLNNGYNMERIRIQQLMWIQQLMIPQLILVGLSN